jgi:TPR repeat protein
MGKKSQEKKAKKLESARRADAEAAAFNAEVEALGAAVVARAAGRARPSNAAAGNSDAAAADSPREEEGTRAMASTQHVRSAAEVAMLVRAAEQGGCGESALALYKHYVTVRGDVDPRVSGASELLLAFKFLSLGSELGNPKAQHQMGKNQRDVAKACPDGQDAMRATSLKAAFALFKSAAEQGLTEAQMDVGVCLAKGLGVATNLSEAAKWYRKAAEGECPVGQLNLALCYHQGLGVDVDHTLAGVWSGRAIANFSAEGGEDAGRLMKQAKELGARITKARVEQLQRAGGGGGSGTASGSGACDIDAAFASQLPPDAPAEAREVERRLLAEMRALAFPAEDEDAVNDESDDDEPFWAPPDELVAREKKAQLERDRKREATAHGKLREDGPSDDTTDAPDSTAVGASNSAAALAEKLGAFIQSCKERMFDDIQTWVDGEFSSGDYDAVKAAAERGDAKAQYAIGFMMTYGFIPGGGGDRAT